MNRRFWSPKAQSNRHAASRTVLRSWAAPSSAALAAGLLLTLPPSLPAQSFSEEIQPPPPMTDEAVLEPDVTIRRRGEDTVEEYRLNGRLYMVKITPSIGPSYYLIDNDGNGLFDKHMSQVYEDFKVPQWVLFSW